VLLLSVNILIYINTHNTPCLCGTKTLVLEYAWKALVINGKGRLYEKKKKKATSFVGSTTLLLSFVFLSDYEVLKVTTCYNLSPIHLKPEKNPKS